MTIQLLQPFNGLSPGIYSNLGAAEEARLVGLGGKMARYYVEGIDGINPVLSNSQEIANRALVSGDRQLMAVSLGMLGQSLPFGATLEPDGLGVMQKAFFSAPGQNYFEPDPLAPGMHGSYFTPALQMLSNELKVFYFNGGCGGISLIRDACGVLETAGWAANRAYRARRASLGTGDPGTKGEFIVEGGRVWECTTGNAHLATLNSDTAVTVNSVAYRKNVTAIVKETGRTSANAKPTFSGSAIVNDTVTDNGAGSTGGGLVWTCVQVGGTLTADATSLRCARTTDLYFDPYGLCNRLRNAIVAAPVNENNRYCIVSNAQTDAGSDPILVARSRQFIGNYMLAVGFNVKPIHTMCLYYPELSKANYDLYETAMSGAGLDSPESYATSLLTTYHDAQSYIRGIPGVTARSASPVYYYLKSLYRHLGTDVNHLLQQPQPNPHVTTAGARICAEAYYPELRRILLNVAA